MCGIRAGRRSYCMSVPHTRLTGGGFTRRKPTQRLSNAPEATRVSGGAGLNRGLRLQSPAAQPLTPQDRELKDTSLALTKAPEATQNNRQQGPHTFKGRQT